MAEHGTLDPTPDRPIFAEGETLQLKHKWRFESVLMREGGFGALTIRTAHVLLDRALATRGGACHDSEEYLALAVGTSRRSLRRSIDDLTLGLSPWFYGIKRGRGKATHYIPNWDRAACKHGADSRHVDHEQSESDMARIRPKHGADSRPDFGADSRPHIPYSIRNPLNGESSERAARPVRATPDGAARPVGLGEGEATERREGDDTAPGTDTLQTETAMAEGSADDGDEIDGGTPQATPDPRQRSLRTFGAIPGGQMKPKMATAILTSAASGIGPGLGKAEWAMGESARRSRAAGLIGEDDAPAMSGADVAAYWTARLAEAEPERKASEAAA